MSETESIFNFETFNKYFLGLLTDLKIVFPEKSKHIDEAISNYVENTKNLSEKTCINTILDHLRKFSREIICHDDRMFNMPLCLVKNVDLSAMWHSHILNDENKEIVWSYLENMYITGNIALKPHKGKQFLDVVKNIKEKYGNKLPVEADPEDEDEGGSSADAVAKATEQLQGVFGSNPVLNNLVKDIASNVGEKLKGQDQMTMITKLLAGDHSMFGDLLDNMSNKYGEQLRNTPIDQKELQQKTQQLFSGMNLGGVKFPFPMPMPTPNNPDLQNAQNELENERQQLQQLEAMQKQLMSQLPPGMAGQMQKMMSQMAPPQGSPIIEELQGDTTNFSPLSQQQSQQSQQKQSNAARPRPGEKYTPKSREENLKFALESGFTTYDFDLFEEALNGWNSVIHEVWWKGMREDFLNRKVWSKEAENAIMMMCRDGLGPGLEVLLGQHPEWNRIMKKAETQ